MAGASNSRAYRYGHDNMPKHVDHASCNHEDNCKGALEYIEDVTMNANDIQRRVLSEILTQNANVEYLRRYEFGSRESDHETFKKKVPVIKYEDLRPYVQRIANGDTSPILCSQPITELLASSGTSGGESNLYPATSKEQERRSLLFGLLHTVVKQHVLDLDRGKGMYFQSIRPEMTMAGGLLARSVLTSFLKSKHFKDNPSTQYTSPKEAFLCLDPSQSMYSHMLCGLYQSRGTVWLGAPFATGFIHAIKFLEKHWQLLCHDIRSGSINPIITDNNVREAVRAILKPDPSLADFIESECSKVSWEGIVIRLWPNAKFVFAVVTGTMAQYIPTLDYYSNGLPIVSATYASSECSFGINLDPFCKPSDVAYTIIPTMAYFEFLPVDCEGKGHELVDLVDVKLDQEYEIVVTTYSGLYRYCVGDILRVAGYKNKAPQFQFVSRKNVVLSIDDDNTNEAELQRAVKNAVNHLIPYDASLSDYTSFVDISTIPGHYVLFWEIFNRNNRDYVSRMIPASLLEDCCLTMEESLGYIYRQARTFRKAIGPLEIRVVENGTFDKLMEYATTKGAASVSQYKTPRSIKDAAMIDLLNSMVISRYHSPKCPKWAPVLGKEFTKAEQGLD